MLPLIPLLLVVASSSGDPETPKGSCADFVTNYRELLTARAQDEANAAPGPSSAAAAAAAAQQDAARVFELTRSRIERSCRDASRAEWECVVDATAYDSLQACRIRALPLVAENARVQDARRELESTARREAPRRDLVVNEWVSRGAIEVSPEMTRAALDARASAPSPQSAAPRSSTEPAAPRPSTEPAAPSSSPARGTSSAPDAR